MASIRSRPQWVKCTSWCMKTSAHFPHHWPLDITQSMTVSDTCQFFNMKYYRGSHLSQDSIHLLLYLSFNYSHVPHQLYIYVTGSSIPYELFKRDMLIHSTNEKNDICSLFCNAYPGIILCMCPTNEWWRYIGMSSLIGWAHTQDDPCLPYSSDSLM